MEKFDFRYSKIMYLVILPIIFIVITTILALFYSGKIDFNQVESALTKTWIAYLIILIDFLVILGIIKGLMMALNLGYYYGIDSQGIIVSKFYKEKKFLFSEMNSYYKLDENQVADLIYRINNNILDFSNLLKIKKQYQLGKTSLQLQKYSGVSIPSASEDTSIDISPNTSFTIYAKALKINPQKGDYILIIMNNGDMFILTPKRANEFYKLLP